MQLYKALLKDLAIGIYDGPHATPKESDDGPIFLGIKNVTEKGRLDLSEIRHVAEEDFAKWTKRITPQKDDLVFSYEATLHLYARIPEGFRGCLGRRMALIRPDPEKIDPRFFHYYLLSPVWRAKMEAITIVGATVNRIPLTLVPDVDVSVPDLQTQAEIAIILSAYDDLIENNRRRITLLEQAARELYREWFVRLRFPGHEHVKIVDGVPDGWERKVLDDICARITDGSHWSPQSVDLGKPMASVKDMREWDFDLTDARMISDEDFKQLVSADCKPLPGDILVAKDGANLNKHTFQVTEERDLVILSSIAIIRPLAGICSEYLTAALRDDVVSQTLKNKVSGAAIPRIVLRDFRTLRILVPNKSIQALWTNAYAPIAEQCRKLFRANATLAKTRDLLLPRLMNGIIPV